ncbi:hypothetical protein D9V71_02785 [Buchnera aphidicola (Macrosiphum euphorbiae)]|nr:hypothetical protein D9V71_02785 [Buchnera aphidicola (Macrosiphum euphorbiae)]
MPSLKLFENSLEIIFLINLSSDVTFIKVLILRIYGTLDNLVIIKKAAHNLFIVYFVYCI